MNNILNILSDQVLIPVLNAVTLIAIGFASAWLKNKFQISNHEKANLVWDDIVDVVETTVVALNQNEVDVLKKNGGWSKEKAQEIKMTAFMTVVTNVGPKLAKIVNDNRDYVMDLIERKVAENHVNKINPQLNGESST